MSNDKTASIVNETIKLTAAVFVIKVLGLVKKSVIAAVCGATLETDAFFISSEIMVALYTVFFSAISISLLSMHTERLLIQGRQSSNNLISAALKYFLPIAILIFLFFAFFSDLVAHWFAPSYQGEQLNYLSQCIRIMSVMFVFGCYYLIINVVLETDKRFLPGKWQGLFQNLFVMIAALFFYQKMGISALLWAFVLAGFVQCVQITWSARNTYHFRWNTDSEKSSIKKLIVLAGPLLIGNAIYELNDIVDKQISSGLGQGSVSILSYGASINEIVTSLIVTSISTVLFSHFATWVAEGNRKQVSDSLKQALCVLLLIIAPITIMCFTAGDTIVSVLYGRGNFGADAIEKTEKVVMAYAAGFYFQAARATIVKVYYAFQNTKVPMMNGAISVGINIVLSILLSQVFGAVGIALATSIAMLLVTFLLLAGLKKCIPDFSLKGIKTDIVKILLISAVVWILAYLLRQNLNTTTYLSFFIMGCTIVFVYALFVILFKVDCAKRLLSEIRQNSNRLI